MTVPTESFVETYSVNQRSATGAFHVTGCQRHPACITLSMTGAFNACRLKVYVLLILPVGSPSEPS